MNKSGYDVAYVTKLVIMILIILVASSFLYGKAKDYNEFQECTSYEIREGKGECMHASKCEGDILRHLKCSDDNQICCLVKHEETETSEEINNKTDKNGSVNISKIDNVNLEIKLYHKRQNIDPENLINVNADTSELIQAITNIEGECKIIINGLKDHIGLEEYSQTFNCKNGINYQLIISRSAAQNNDNKMYLHLAMLENGTYVRKRTITMNILTEQCSKISCSEFPITNCLTKDMGLACKDEFGNKCFIDNNKCLTCSVHTNTLKTCEDYDIKSCNYDPCNINSGPCYKIKRVILKDVCANCPSDPGCGIYKDAETCELDPCHDDKTCSWINNKCEDKNQVW